MPAPVQFDLDELRRLAAMGATYREVAQWFHCSLRTVERRLRPPETEDDETPENRAWQESQTNFRMSLRRQQMKVAMGSGKGAVQMLIHMSKHHLGETDKRANDGQRGEGGGIVFVLEDSQ